MPKPPTRVPQKDGKVVFAVGKKLTGFNALIQNDGQAAIVPGWQPVSYVLQQAHAGASMAIAIPGSQMDEFDLRGIDAGEKAWRKQCEISSH